jgi:hypothetical protein
MERCDRRVSAVSIVVARLPERDVPRIPSRLLAKYLASTMVMAMSPSSGSRSSVARGSAVLRVMGHHLKSTTVLVDRPSGSHTAEISARADWKGARKILAATGTRPVAVRLESLDGTSDGSVLCLTATGPCRLPVSFEVGLALCAFGCRTVLAAKGPMLGRLSHA